MRAWKVIRQTLFGLSLSVNAALLSLILLVCTGPLLATGEHFEALAILWFLTLPGVAVAGAAMSFAIQRYLDYENARARIAFHLALALAASFAGHLAGWAVLQLV